MCAGYIVCLFLCTLVCFSVDFLHFLFRLYISILLLSLSLSLALSPVKIFFLFCVCQIQGIYGVPAVRLALAVKTNEGTYEQQSAFKRRFFSLFFIRSTNKNTDKQTKKALNLITLQHVIRVGLIHALGVSVKKKFLKHSYNTGDFEFFVQNHRLATNQSKH